MGAVWEEMSKRVRNEERKGNRMRIEKYHRQSSSMFESLFFRLKWRN